MLALAASRHRRQVGELTKSRFAASIVV